MVLYIAFISTMNLCLGYALGVYLGKMPALPRLPKRRKRATNDKSSEAVSTPPAPTKANDGANDGAAEQPTPESAAITSEEHVIIDDFAKGLADFQAQLQGLDEKLHSGEADEETLGQCADQLEHASDDYLQRANEACEQLAPSDGDSEQIVEEKLQVKQSILEQSEIVKEQRASCSDLDTSNTDTAAKELLDTSHALSGAADTLQEQLGDIFVSKESDEPEVANTDSAEDFATEEHTEEPTEEHAEEPTKQPTHSIDRDAAQQRVDDFYQADKEDSQLIAAVVEFDNMEIAQSEVVERLLASLTDLVDAELSDQHATTEYAEGQLLLLLSGETVDSATQVVEQVRQRVDATNFSADGDPCEASVSCALIDARHAADRPSLESQLTEALGEARRYGSNKTFCHDGSAASPVVPPELTIASEERAI